MNSPEFIQISDNADIFGMQRFERQADEAMRKGNCKKFHHLAVDGDGAVAFEEYDFWMRAAL